ncbi:hypothetical protein [Fulvivirga sp.]|jgi:hypothetical protein|uniref:hypothetical protein n=1 Tax=Fulvivirga sp. TaxID=1931237 RepID=UPI0032EDE68E
MKKIYLISLLTLCHFTSQSQQLYLIADQGFGFERQSITVGSHTNEMSLTSLFGLGVGVDINLFGPLVLSGSASYHLNFGVNKTTGSAGSSSSSHSFNVKRLSAGLATNFRFEEKKVGFRFGTGLDFNFPGTFNAKINSDEHGEVNYDNAIGYYITAAIPFDISDNLELAPYVAFRNYELKASSWERADLSSLNPSLAILNGNSVALGVLLLF